MKYKLEKNCVKNLFLSAVLSALALFAVGCVPPENSNGVSNDNANAVSDTLLSGLKIANSNLTL